MDEAQLIENLQDIFDDIFDETQPTVTMELTAADVLEWDSLANIQLIVAIEKEFGIKFIAQEVEQLNSVGGLITSILAKLH